MLAQNYWLSIFLTVWITHVTEGGRQEKASKGQVQCVITSPFNSSYVKAHLMKYTPGKGCMTNVTSSKRQEVHVINVKVKNDAPRVKRLQVNLRVEPRSIQSTDVSNDYQRPLVFVLYSDIAVKWKVELIGLVTRSPKHLFVVPSHSRIRFKKSKFRKHVKNRVVDMPDWSSPQDLLTWTQKRFKTVSVTSYSELDGTSLLFRVGIAPDVGDVCNVSALVESQHAATSQIEVQPTAGCVSEGRKILLARPVYIIELLSEPPDSFGKKDSLMELEVTSINNEAINKDFYLIIKSPSSLKWAVRSRKVQGWIDIVTDAEIDLKAIRMHTVALRKEVMKATGSELIKWAEYYIAPVEAYTRIQEANRIRLLLHPAGKSSLLPGPVDSHDSSDVGTKLRQTIQTECKDESMVISIPNNLLQANGLDIEQITLLDPSCGAMENSTHVILKTSLSRCNTKFLQVDDEDVYSNAIVIHATGVTDALIEEFGSAFGDSTEMSGSGSHDLSEGTYMDDEDFPYHSVEIDVKCYVPAAHTNIEPSGSSQGLNYKLQLYRNDRFLTPDSISPMTVANNSRLYVQASIMYGSHLDVNVENCWITPASSLKDKEATRKEIIRNGCAKESSITWHNSPNSVQLSTQSVSRFSFQVRDFFHSRQNTLGVQPTLNKLNQQQVFHSDRTYLHCEVTICLKDTQAQPSRIPKCPKNKERICESMVNSVNHYPPRSRQIGNKLLVAGPWEITDIIKVIDGGTSHTEEEVNTPNLKKTDSNIGGSTQPQSVIIEGLDSATVVGIAFAAFAIGILLTGALWFIHTHTGPAKRGVSSQGSAETSGESTPNSSSPISA